ncbi:MAG: 3'-5' exonuclease, partial [Promethearchaeota archaeon]
LFKSEKNLLIETFRLIWEYPVVITFNGDNFDLNYLSHRADKLKIDKDLNPIQVKRGFGILSKAECDLRNGIHIDLFNIFFNRSISGYAFGGVYESASLNAISAALLGEEKYQHDEIIHEMEYDILSWYNLKDSILTLELTKFNNSLVWNLIILLCRITKMPVHDMVRRQISTWIQNIFYFEHRRKNSPISDLLGIREFFLRYSILNIDEKILLFLGDLKLENGKRGEFYPLKLMMINLWALMLYLPCREYTLM